MNNMVNGLLSGNVGSNIHCMLRSVVTICSKVIMLCKVTVTILINLFVRLGYNVSTAQERSRFFVSHNNKNI